MGKAKVCHIEDPQASKWGKIARKAGTHPAHRPCMALIEGET